MKTIKGFEKEFSADDLNEDGARLVYMMPGHMPSIVTTISKNGTVNIGTFEQTVLCSNRPPIITITISPKSDTLKNLQMNKVCTIGFPYPECLQIAYDAGARLPYGVSEYEYIDGIDLVSTEKIDGFHLQQCWLSMEGKLLWKKKAGDHFLCAVEIVKVIFDGRYWHEDKVQRRKSLPTAYYATAGEFCVDGEWKKISVSNEIKNQEHSD